MYGILCSRCTLVCSETTSDAQENTFAHLSGHIQTQFILSAYLIFSDRHTHVKRSLSLVFRPQDNSAEGFSDWAFMTTHSWDEDPRGEWMLEIENVAGLNDYGTTISFFLISVLSSFSKHTLKQDQFT